MSNKSVCISHASDVDGITSAALAKRCTNANIILTNYGDLISHLKSLSRPSELYICDLGLSPGTTAQFLESLEKIARFSSIVYIDHHPIIPKTALALKKIGVELVHSPEDCAAVLTYSYFENRLSSESSILACYGAITDYLEKGPRASVLLDRYDRNFLFLESTLMSHAMGVNRSTNDFNNNLVNELSKLKYPHQIQGLEKMAIEQAESVALFISELREKVHIKKKFAYVQSDQFSTGTTANLVRCATGINVGVAFNVKDSNFVEASLRASSNYMGDLGKIAEEIADKLGGFGGGHPKASGMRIPINNLEIFLKLLASNL